MDFYNIKTETGQYKFFCAGKWQCSKSKQKMTIKSPVDGSILGDVCAITKEEVEEVIKGAHEAQKNWADLPLSKRTAILSKAAQLLNENIKEIADILVKEIGKPISSAMDEVKRTADIIELTAEEAKSITGEAVVGEAFPGADKSKISFTTRLPLGVILAISPFNYPINLSGSKIAPALVTGNSVIFKPPSQGVISSLYFTEVLHQAGLPPGVLNTVTGSGSEIGDFLVSHPLINLIAFTGSTAVGKHIASIAGMKPLLMELGGKDAAIVLEDANLENAAKQIVSGAYLYSGQRCTAVKRVLVLEGVADKLLEKLVPLVKALKVGKPQDDCDVCPLITDKSADFVQSLIEEAKTKGAKVLVEGKRVGNLIYPWLFDCVTEDMALAWEEPFGPVLPIIRVKDIDEAIRICNKSEYGLQASIFTENINKAFTIAGKLDVGTVQINGKTARGPDHFPFVGTKSSGMGVQGIKYSIEAMTRIKATVLNVGR